MWHPIHTYVTRRLGCSAAESIEPSMPNHPKPRWNLLAILRVTPAHSPDRAQSQNLPLASIKVAATIPPIYGLPHAPDLQRRLHNREKRWTRHHHSDKGLHSQFIGRCCDWPPNDRVIYWIEIDWQLTIILFPILGRMCTYLWLRSFLKSQNKMKYKRMLSGDQCKKRGTPALVANYYTHCGEMCKEYGAHSGESESHGWRRD